MNDSISSSLPRILTVLVAGLLVFGGWTLLKVKILTPRPAQDSTVTAPAPRPARKILWTSNGSDLPGGDDPRAVFSGGLNRYLGGQVSSATMIPLDNIDPTIVSQTDDTAELTVTLQGIRYFGKLEWSNSGWQLVELSRN